MDRIQRKMLEDKLKQGSINESNDKFEKLSKDERDKKIFYGINQVILKQNELALKIQTNKHTSRKHPSDRTLSKEVITADLT